MFPEKIQQKRLPLTRDSYVLFLYAAAIAIAGMSLLAGYIAEALGPPILKDESNAKRRLLRKMMAWHSSVYYGLTDQ